MSRADDEADAGDDLLARATRALRETTCAGEPDERGGEPGDAAVRGARARVLARAAAERRASLVRRRRLLTALPFAAVLAAGTAFAARGSLVAAAHAVKAALGLETPAPTAPAAPFTRAASSASGESGASDAAGATSASLAPPAPTPAVATPPTPSAPLTVTPSPPVPSAPSPATHTGPSREWLASSASSAASAPGVDARAADLARYKQAHELHFVIRDHARALAAWDAYLREFPAGTFAIDARWNRALCLVRLGRAADARLALAPFARGEVSGGYRQAEARALMEALASADAGAQTPE
jgi:hypothetical protein